MQSLLHWHYCIDSGAEVMEVYGIRVDSQTYVDHVPHMSKGVFRAVGGCLLGRLGSS